MLAANVALDRDSDERLSAAGWLGIRVWEHEEMAVAALTIAEALRVR